jgi:ABC-type transport system involved in multi-copper enzyme maturation permease subunit
MIALSLLQLVAVRRGPFLAICGLLLGLFQFLICAVVTSADVGGAIRALMASLPPVVRALLSSQFGALSERDLLAFAWNHPIAHALGTAAAIVLASRAVAGEIETGAMELLLGQPISRHVYLATQVLFAILALAALVLAGTAGTVLGQRRFRLEGFGAGPMLGLALDYFLLQLAFFGITLAMSAIGREGGRVASAGFLVALVSYFAQAIGALWDDAAFVLPFTLHHYFSPRSILVEGAALVRPLATLGAVALAGLAIATWRFARRDFP